MRYEKRVSPDSEETVIILTITALDMMTLSSPEWNALSTYLDLIRQIVSGEWKEKHDAKRRPRNRVAQARRAKP